MPRWRTRSGQRRRHARHAAHRGALPALRRAPRPCLRRRAEADRAALLHERGRAHFRAGRPPEREESHETHLCRDHGAGGPRCRCAGGLVRRAVGCGRKGSPFRRRRSTRPAGGGTEEVAVLAGGCFWGVQGVFQHVEGVEDAVSGYAGGMAETAHYRVVGSGRTGHAESVQVTYDPKKISYGKLLQVYFSVAHDPTELNRQGPDTGTQYRSTIFPQNATQAKVAKAYIDQLNKAQGVPGRRLSQRSSLGSASIRPRTTTRTI